MHTLRLVLAVTGIALFVAGDLAWLLRQTFDRPISMRVSGTLLGSGVVLFAIALLFFAFDL